MRARRGAGRLAVAVGCLLASHVQAAKGAKAAKEAEKDDCGFAKPAKPLPPGRISSGVLRLIRAAALPTYVGGALNASVRQLRSESPNWGLSRYCGVSNPRIPQAVATTCAQASVIVKPTGRLVYRPEKTAGAFCLEDDAPYGWGSSIVARIATTVETDDEAYCGPIYPGQTYRSPTASKERPIVSLRVWASWSSEELALTQKDAKASVTALRDKYLQSWFFQKWAAAVYTANPQTAKDLSALLDQTKEDTLRDIDQGKNEFADLGSLEVLRERIERPPLKKAILDAETELARKLPKIDADPKTNAHTLCDYVSNFAIAADGVTPPAALTADLKLTTDGSDISAAVLGLGVAFQPEGADLSDQKSEKEKPEQGPMLPWPVFEGQIPGTREGFSRTVPLQSGDGRKTDKVNLAFADERLLVFGYGMARDQSSGSTQTKGDTLAFIKGDAIQSTSGNAGSVVASLVRGIIVVMGLPVPGATAGKPAPPPPPNAKKGSIPVPCEGSDSLCKAFTDQFNAPVLSQDDLPALPSGWKAPFTSSVIVADPLEDARRYSILLCRGVDTCDTSAKSSAIVSSVDFSTEAPHPFISTVTELAGNWSSSTPLGGWTFDPVIGTSDPSQLFVLKQHNSSGDHMTVSQLLVVYPFYARHELWAQGFALGFGPSLFQGTSADLFSQWNGRLLWEPPFARGVTLSVGLSARGIEVPHNLPTGAVVVGEMGKAPAFAEDHSWVLLYSAGLGIDLSILGKAWDQAGAAFSSKGESSK
jgi:hypothetical protein